MRAVLMPFLLALAVFSVIMGWGLGAVLVAGGFASLYARSASKWLNQ